MSKNKKKENTYDDGSYVVKKSRKGNVVAFIVCFLIAVMVWLYASGAEMKRQEESGLSTEKRILSVGESVETVV